MRHVDPPTRPHGWQTHVLKKGRAWLNDGSADNRSAERPSAFWLRYRDEIGAAFDYICCYTVVYVANGEADHFVPWGDVRGTRKALFAYQWSNIRYADGWVNRSKGADRFPDPFVVMDDWFELDLPRIAFTARPCIRRARSTRSRPRTRRTPAPCRPFSGGSITALQRFGGAPKLNLHMHGLVFDGLYERG